jgi:hypothetical protein
LSSSAAASTPASAPRRRAPPPPRENSASAMGEICGRRLSPVLSSICSAGARFTHHGPRFARPEARFAHTATASPTDAASRGQSRSSAPCNLDSPAPPRIAGPGGATAPHVGGGVAPHAGRALAPHAAGATAPGVEFGHGEMWERREEEGDKG